MSRYNPNSPGVKAEFGRLCELEPRLKALRDEIAAVKDDPKKSSFCANALWYGNGDDYGFKGRLKELVGWGAGYPPPTPDTLGVGEQLDVKVPNIFERGMMTAGDLVRMHKEAAPRIPNFPEDLITTNAYDIAYDVLYDMLPNCRNCSC